jgi:hypothetical protein
MNRIIVQLVAKAQMFGLNKSDLDNIIDLYEHYEFGLSLDTLVTQLNEHNIEIDQETYDLIRDASIKMDLPEKSYSFMKELIKR